MAKACLAVRAEVPEADRERFHHWYATDHLPRGDLSPQPVGWVSVPSTHPTG